MFGFAANALAVDFPLHDWPAPAAWSPSAAGGAKGLLSETNPMPFLAVTPCRIADTRNANGPYGGPALAANTTRDFAIWTQCGIPNTARAVSLNLAVTSMNTAGNLIAWPAGASIPTVSVINWNASSVAIANAAVVQLNNSGAMSVRSNVPPGGVVNLIIDVNGYYYDSTEGELAPDEYIGITGVYNGIFGFGGGVLFAENFGTAANVYGLNALSASGGDGSAGVRGANIAMSGVNYGVKGESASVDPGSAGVYGVDQGVDPGLAGSNLSSGVRGASSGGYGGLFVSKVAGAKMAFINNDNSAGAYVYGGYSAAVGLAVIGNFIATGTKSFVDPHPTDATKAIAYVALEGPEAGTYFRGRGRIHNGVGTIEVPESFRLVTDDEGLTVQITPIGQVANVAVFSADLSSVSVKSSARELEFYYVVNGVRRAFKNYEPIVDAASVFVPEGPETRMSSALSDEQKASLIANGTFNADGTVNLKTAEAVGWTKIWAAKAAARKAAAEKRARALADPSDQAKDIGHNRRMN